MIFTSYEGRAVLNAFGCYAKNSCDAEGVSRGRWKPPRSQRHKPFLHRILNLCGLRRLGREFLRRAEELRLHFLFPHVRHANAGRVESVSRRFLSSVFTVACNSNLPRSEQKWQVLAFVHDRCDRALWTCGDQIDCV